MVKQEVKDLKQNLLWWSFLLEEYKYHMWHTRGKHQLNADALSRV